MCFLYRRFDFLLANLWVWYFSIPILFLVQLYRPNVTCVLFGRSTNELLTSPYIVLFNVNYFEDLRLF